MSSFKLISDTEILFPQDCALIDALAMAESMSKRIGKEVSVWSETSLMAPSKRIATVNLGEVKFVS